MENIIDFKKRKEYLICVDSDGCVMNTMDIKHIECFGPCMVKEWNLEKWEKTILSRWNDINLYTSTRGINRFKGLVISLTEINEKYLKIEDLQSLIDWTQNTKELSNNALLKEIELKPNSVILKKVLSWSKAVNLSINALPQEKKLPFEMAKTALMYAHQKADVAIVSSANLDAVMEEWEKYGLLDYVDIVLAQNCGSKAFCIAELLKKGYDNQKVLMCGDAPGDMNAAQKNNVLYYPILVRKENFSWEQFIDNACDKFIDGTFKGEFQQQKIDEFLKNLGE
ncbi:MAG: HAD hydrolase-like protein [Clostridia bacterium]|nr:HAD hydrolase-like protein [Clostridia bacterium]